VEEQAQKTDKVPPHSQNLDCRCAVACVPKNHPSSNSSTHPAYHGCCWLRVGCGDDLKPCAYPDHDNSNVPIAIYPFWG